MDKGQPLCGRADEIILEERAANVTRGTAQVTEREAVASGAAVTS